ncbi:hypothetical protein QFC22_005502 [Naganishia vaughanmartiniae]|uniref:Uncharacterized protein n=1 Tax=Naganishia vaughanmartiniae TaxID=1424756 RepID=A0ACC2WU01_9TREE|nr:hypothetical protein QFC22_005502 [Naganishia vaughanmartiniae]
MQSSNNPISTPADEWSQSTLAALNSSSALAAAEDGAIATGGSPWKNLSGREQAAAQLAAKLAAGGQGQGKEMTVDQQLAQEHPVIPTRHAEPASAAPVSHAQAQAQAQQAPTAIPAKAIAEIPVLVEKLPVSTQTNSAPAEPALYAVTDAPSAGLHSTASGIPHAFPISASAQTSGFTEPSSSAVPASARAVGGQETLVAVPISTVVPGHAQKTVNDLLDASPSVPAPVTSVVGAGTGLPSHNPFNPEHTPGYLDIQQRATTTGGIAGEMTPGGMTPGMELPGGWGAVLKTQGAAALPHTETSLTQDVTTALHEVGRTAFGLLPESVVDKLSAHHQPAAGTSATTPALPSSGDVRETAVNVGHTLVGGTINAGSALGQGAVNVGSQVGQGATTVGSQLVGGAVVAGQSAAELSTQVAGGAVNLGSAVGQSAVNAGSAVVGGAVNATTAVGQTAANAGSAVVEGTMNAGAAVRDTTAGAVGGIVGGVESLVEQAREALGHMHLPGLGAIVGGSGAQEEQREAGVKSVSVQHPTTTRTAGVQQGDTIVDHAKNMASELMGASQSKAEEAYNAVRQGVAPASTTTTTGTRGVEQGGAAGWRGTLEGLGERMVTSVADFGGHSTNPSSTYAAAADKEINASLPSEETTGAHPGEQSGGVGALPGSKFATRVAVLPEEREQAQEERRDTVGGGSSNAISSGQGESQEGYAPSGPAMALGGATTSSHSHHHGEGGHRSVTEIIKDGANKHSSSTHTTTDSSKSATGPSATVVASSSERRHDGYAPSGPVADLGSTGTTATPSYLNDAAHPSQAKKTALGGQYELGGLSSGGVSSGSSGIKDSSRVADKEDVKSGVAASDKKVEVLASSGGRQGEFGSSGARESESVSSSARHLESAASGARSSDSTSYDNRQVRPTSSGAPIGASSPLGASQPVTSTTSTTTTHISHGSGPMHDLAPPLGVIVGATPIISSHIQTDQSTHEPILPGNIHAALPKEPIAVVHPTETTGLSSVGDSGVNTPGSTLESEHTHGTQATTTTASASPLAKFQAPRPDRTDSHASTTAIMHGKLGNTHHEQETTSTLKDTSASSSSGSNLKAVAEKELPKTPASTGQSAPTSHSTSTNTATRAPGSEAGAVGGLASSGTASSGHASSGLASSTQHTSTPAATTAAAVIGKGKDMTTPNSEPHHTVKEEFASVGHGTLDKPASSIAAKQAPKTDSSAAPGQGRPVAAASSPTSATSGADHTASAHQRTGSTESGGSKRSFLDKIKSKLHHNKH